MKRYLFLLLAVIIVYTANGQPSGLIVNEFSQGTGGTKEFMEFVVIGQRTCSDSTIDLRGWIFDDHNGWYSGSGSAGGSYRLAINSNWANVPIGSIILIYNQGDKNTNITLADDPTDSNHDLVYVLPLSSNYLEFNSQPGNGGGGSSFVYPSTGWGGGGGYWSGTVGLNNGGDAVISVDPTSPGVAFHSIAYSSVSTGGQTPTIQKSNVGSGDNCYLTNSSYTSATAYTIGNAGTSAETPGAFNTTANGTWINSLRSATGGASSKDTIHRTVCQGKSYIFDGKSYNSTGYYTATYTAVSGCDSLVTLDLLVTPGPSVAVAYNDVSCNGGNNGSATVTASGGIPPYSYLWNTSPVQVTNIAKNLSAGTYKVTVTDDSGCIDTAIVTIAEPTEIVLTVNDDKQTCPGFNGGAASAAATGGTPPYTFVWNTSPQQTGSVANNLGEGVYTVSVTDNNGCIKTNTVSVNAFNVGPIKVEADNNTICEGQKTKLTASGMSTYTWSPADGLSCTACPDPEASVQNSKTYTVVGVDTNGCKDTGTVALNVLGRVPVSVGPEMQICSGAAAQLTAEGGESYQWSPATSLTSSTIANPLASPEITTTYQVIIKENACFEDTLYQTVTVYPSPTVDAGRDIHGLPGAEIQLNPVVTGATEYEWSPGDGLSCTMCADPMLKIKNSTTVYTITVKSAGGCSATDELKVIATCEGTELFMPNTFTPNGDGYNDYFYPMGSGIGVVKRFKVMSSWGEVVYADINVPANLPSRGWDGTYKGQQLSPDVFVYMVELGCGDGKTKVVTGDITLIR